MRAASAALRKNPARVPMPLPQQMPSGPQVVEKMSSGFPSAAAFCRAFHRSVIQGMSSRNLDWSSPGLIAAWMLANFSEVKRSWIAIDGCARSGCGRGCACAPASATATQAPARLANLKLVMVFNSPNAKYIASFGNEQEPTRENSVQQPARPHYPRSGDREGTVGRRRSLGAGGQHRPWLDTHLN